MLVVDDERPIRDLLTVILQGEGYEVICAGDGEEGLRLANRTKHDAILLDLKMPIMDGTEFARRYRSTGGGKPIVVITAAREPEEKAAEMDPCAYLAKPFELQSLLESLRACTQGPSPAGR